MIVTSYLALAAMQLETSGEYVCNESPTINVLLCGYRAYVVDYVLWFYINLSETCVFFDSLSVHLSFLNIWCLFPSSRFTRVVMS